MKKKVILGNFITMDEKRPFAEAALVKDGVFAYIGSAEEAKKLAGADAEVLDYGKNYIYPGFLESHSHGYLAGNRAIGQANLAQVRMTDYDKYREIMKEYIENNPQRTFYMAAGWMEDEQYVSKAYLDEICSDKPLIMHSSGGHSMLFNTKALEMFGIDADYAKRYGYDQVHVDKNGEPDGYICEGPVFEITPKLPVTLDEAKEYILAWQDFALKGGFTAVGDAGVEVAWRDTPRAYYELEQEGKLKLRTYAYMYVTDNIEDPKAEVARIAEQRATMSGEYFHIIGPKAFLDGVTEAHTGWQNQDYEDQPGYHGVERFNDHDKMVEMLVESDREGMSVHVHSEGGGATHFMLGCIEDAEKITGDKDQRNVLAHLHFVTDEDIRRMAETGSIPAVAPLWTPEVPGNYEVECGYVGKELADQSYPIKSFFDAGANVVFHSDYPVSPLMNIKYSIYTAEKRVYPDDVLGGKDSCKRQVLFPKKWHLFFLKCGKLFSRVCGILFSRTNCCFILNRHQAASVFSYHFPFPSLDRCLMFRANKSKDSKPDGIEALRPFLLCACQGDFRGINSRNRALARCCDLFHVPLDRHILPAYIGRADTGGACKIRNSCRYRTFILRGKAAGTYI